MKPDIKKIAPSPKDTFETVRFMGEAQGHIIDAYYIMKATLINNTGEYKEINEKRMRDFIKQFES